MPRRPRITPQPQPTTTTVKHKKRYQVQDLDQFLATYPDHSGTMLYLYRIWPAIRREPSYITKLPPPFPVSIEEWTQTEFGGGRYRICFTDNNHQPTAQVCDAIFDVDHLQYEPNLEYLELADPNDVTEKELSKRQAAFIEHLRRNGKLPPESRFFQAPGTATAAAPATRPGQDGAVKDVLDFAREVIDSKKPGDIEGYAQQKVVDSLAGGFSRIIELSQKMQPAADSAGTTAVFTTLTTLVQMMQTQILEQNKQIAALTTAPRQTPAPLESFEMIDKIAGTLDKLRGSGGGGGGGNWWDSIAAALAPALPPLINLLMQRNSAPAMPQQPGIGPAPAALPPAMPQQQTGPPPDFLQMLGTTILNNLQQGFEGDDLAHSICVQQGNVIYLQLAGLGVEGLISALKSVPVWQALQAAEPQVREFIEQFIRYKDEGGNPSEEVSTQPIHGPAAGSARPSASTVQPPATGNQR